MNELFTENDPNDPYADRTKRKPTTEQLQRIRAKCEELLNYSNSSTHAAGWRSTIAAIDYVTAFGLDNDSLAGLIIAAWDGIV